MIYKSTHQEVSQYFISLSNETGSFISNLKLQKLLYYTQAWHLALFDEPLFDGEFEAWIHGPVLPEAYQDYKRFSWKPILIEGLGSKEIDALEANLMDRQLELFSDVVVEYFGLSGFELEKMTHLEDPWKRARRGLADDEPSNNIIENQWMIDYYKEYLVDG